MGERPIQKAGVVHGRTLKPFTWFYPAQIEALKALWVATSNAYGIPLDFPKNDDGTPCTTVHDGCKKLEFSGFCNHYNFTNRKIDCAGLDMEGLLKEARLDILVAGPTPLMVISLVILIGSFTK